MNRIRGTPPSFGPLSFLAAIAFFLSCSAREPQDVELVADALHVTVTIRIPGGAGDPKAVEAVRAAMDEVRWTEGLLNYYDPDSNLSRLNRERTLSRQEMGEDLWGLLHRCRELWKATDGAFDVSVGPLIQAWKVGTNEARVPSATEIVAATASIGLDRVIWEEDEIRLPDGMELHLGGVLKGYALDRAASVLAARGVRAALINAGGDIFALGERSPGRKWRVGIRHPRSTEGYFGRIEIADGGAATSGDYMQFFEVGGRRYHHILDPRSGFPSEACVSATVVAREAVAADAWATAAVVLGKEMDTRSRSLAAAGVRIEYLLVLPAGDVIHSAGFPLAERIPTFLTW